VYLVPALSLALIFSKWENSLSKLVPPIIIGLILVPIVWDVGWRVLGLGINGYVNCILLSFLLGTSLGIYYLSMMFLKSQLLSLAFLLLSYIIIFFIVSHVPRLG